MGIDIDRCVNGDSVAWDTFVATFTHAIHASVQRTYKSKGHNCSDADLHDATQEIFMRLINEDYRLLRSYDAARASVPVWLALVTRSTVLNILSRKQLRRVQLNEQALAAVPEPKQEADELNIPAELLTARQKLVLHLLFDCAYEVPRISQLLGVDEQTIRSTKHKALIKLREHFGALEKSKE